MHRVNYLLAITLGCSWLSAQASHEVRVAISPEEFKYGAELTRGSQSIRKIDIGADILQKMLRTDLGDLRVFDSEGRLMEAVVLRKQLREQQDWQTLIFFPLLSQGKNGLLPGIVVERSADGEVVRVDASRLAETTDRQLTGYLIENMQTEKQLEKLQLRWTQQDMDHVMHLRLEYSDDLKRWRQNQGDIVLASLKYGDHVLMRNTIEPEVKNSRFMRLSLQGDRADFKLEQIQGQYNTPGGEPVSWSAIGGLSKQAGEAGRYGFELRSVVPVEKMRMQFDEQQEAFVAGRLYSRMNEQSSWHLRHRSVEQYALSHEQARLLSEPVTMPSVHDPYWLFETANGQDLLAEQMPQLELLIPQHELYFIANGQAPYSLVWGNATAAAPGVSMQRLLKKIKQDSDDVEQVYIQREFVNDTQDTASHALPWKTIVLWMVLVLGVAVVTVMAYRLKRDMGESAE